MVVTWGLDSEFMLLCPKLDVSQLRIGYKHGDKQQTGKDHGNYYKNT